MISYYFNATQIIDGVSNDGVLTLTSVTAANTGPYQCFANNVRADHSALWVVTVRDPSECYVLYNCVYVGWTQGPCLICVYVVQSLSALCLIIKYDST